MKIMLNGEKCELTGDGTLAQLLEELGADGERVAVMVNGNIITRDHRPSFRLSEGDIVEVLTFAGGG